MHVLGYQGLSMVGRPPWVWGSPPLHSAFWNVHPPRMQSRCPGDLVTVVTGEGGPVGEHRKGLARVTHGFWR